MHGRSLMGALPHEKLDEPLIAPVSRPMQGGHLQALRLKIVIRKLLEQELDADELSLLDIFKLLVLVVLLGFVSTPA